MIVDSLYLCSHGHGEVAYSTRGGECPACAVIASLTADHDLAIDAKNDENAALEDEVESLREQMAEMRQERSQDEEGP